MRASNGSRAGTIELVANRGDSLLASTTGYQVTFAPQVDIYALARDWRPLNNKPRGRRDLGEKHGDTQGRDVGRDLLRDRPTKVLLIPLS